MDLLLRHADRVRIVGGGPAGSFSALHLLRLARQHRLDLEVLIYEPHDFFLPDGTHNCKGCAGILSAGMLDHIASLGLSLPPEVAQPELRGYAVHVPGQVTTIRQPVAGRRIASVYRGTGPRGHKGRLPANFDGYLLSQAVAACARHVAARVRRVTREGRPVVWTEHASQPADLPVVAIGVNSRSPLDPAFGYHPPRSAVMAKVESGVGRRSFQRAYQPLCERMAADNREGALLR